MRQSVGAESIAPSRWATRLKHALWGVAGFVVVGLWGSSYLSTRSIAEQNRANRESLRSIGADANAHAVLRAESRGDNAATDYLRLHELVTVRDSRVVELRVEPDGTISRASWDRFEAWVRDAEPLIRIAAEAAKKPKCAFPRDWSLGYRMQFPEYGSLRMVTRMVLGAASIDARAKRWESAFAHVRVARSIAKHIRQEPGMMAAVTSSGCENYLYSFLQPLIHQHGSDPAFAKVAHAFLSESVPPIDVVQTIRHELATQTATIRRISEGMYSFEALNNPRTSRKSPFDFLFKFDYHRVRVESLVLGRHLAFFREVADAPPSKLPDALNRIDRTFARDRSTYGRIVAMIVPAYRQMASLTHLSETRARLSLAGLWLETERAKRGAYPERLPNAPWVVDPYGGRPFAYEPHRETYRLLSVGPDGVRFDGNQTLGRRMGRNDDIDFHAGKN